MGQHSFNELLEMLENLLNYCCIVVVVVGMAVVVVAVGGRRKACEMLLLKF